MVRIDEILGLALVIAVGSTLIGSKKGYSYQKENLSITTNQFYKPQLDFNLQSIASIKDARTRLLSLGDKIKSITLDQEKQKTQYQVDYLQTRKKEAGAILSQLQKIKDIGSMFERYSPRVRGITIRKTGIDPVDQSAIEKGKKASQEIIKIDEIIKNLDFGIISAQKSFQSLQTL